MSLGGWVAKMIGVFRYPLRFVALHVFNVNTEFIDTFG